MLGIAAGERYASWVPCELRERNLKPRDDALGVLARRAGPLARISSTSMRRRPQNRSRGPVWQGAQVVVDATLVSPVRRDGDCRPGADREPGLAMAIDRKRRTYPKLAQSQRCRLLVFGIEVGGRLRESTLTFLRLLAPGSRAPAGAVVSDNSNPTVLANCRARIVRETPPTQVCRA